MGLSLFSSKCLQVLVAQAAQAAQPNSPARVGAWGMPGCVVFGAMDETLIFRGPTGHPGQSRAHKIYSSTIGMYVELQAGRELRLINNIMNISIRTPHRNMSFRIAIKVIPNRTTRNAMHSTRLICCNRIHLRGGPGPRHLRYEVRRIGVGMSGSSCHLRRNGEGMRRNGLLRMWSRAYIPNSSWCGLRRSGA